MLQRYKVRLGDGTVLQVDLDGLRTWLTDSRATVQVAATQEWRPLRQFLADEESAARLARALVPPQPRRSPASSPSEAPLPGLPAEPAIGAPPLVQALADETATSDTWRDTGEDAAAEAPAIRLKPLDDERPAPRASARARAYAVEEEEEEEEGDERHDGLEGPLLRVIATFGALLSRCLDPLTALARGWPPRPEDEPAPRRLDPSRLQGSRGEPPPPPVRLRAEPVGDEPPETRASSGFTGKLAGWLAGSRGWVARLGGGGRPSPTGPTGEPAPNRPSAPAARVPLEAPTPVSELPALRFAEPPDAREEDVYEDAEEADRVLPVLWLWTKRIVLGGGLVAVGVLAALNWATWFPRAAEVGQTVFTEIDRQAHSRERAREQEQALSDAAARLPHLAPATIRLVLAASSSGVLEPAEVFQLASEAADRGRSALAPAEAAELETLQRDLLGHLRPPERARVAEYDRARATRVVFPFENPHTLELVARGARAMPPASLERLQALLGKAVAAGLGPSAGASASRPR